MKQKIAMIGLGCPKNQVDAELMLARLAPQFTIVGEVADADLVIVNTCGFIEDAKREAIETILQCVELKNEGMIRKILVTGCLAERYQHQIKDEIPEVDGVHSEAAILLNFEKKIVLIATGKNKAKAVFEAVKFAEELS